MRDVLISADAPFLTLPPGGPPDHPACHATLSPRQPPPGRARPCPLKCLAPVRAPVLQGGGGEANPTALRPRGRSRCRARPAPLPRRAGPGQGAACHLPVRRRIPALRALPQRGETALERARP